MIVIPQRLSLDKTKAALNFNYTPKGKVDPGRKPPP